MKTIGILLAWAVLAGGILYGVMSPDHGLMFKNPMMTLSFGMIGLGLCLESRKHFKTDSAN